MLSGYTPIGLAQRVAKLAVDALGLDKIVRASLLNYETTHHRFLISDAALPESGWRMLHLSDLHVDGLPDGGDQLVEAVSRIQADFCVMTGDFVDPMIHDLPRVRSILKRILSAMHTRFDVLGVLGNHDSDAVAEILHEAGVHVLRNEVYIARTGTWPVSFFGFDWLQPCVEHMTNQMPSPGLRVGFAHSPRDASLALQIGAHVFLCGHTHGGQVCLPGGLPLLGRTRPRLYLRGAWSSGSLQGYTSRGVGVCGGSPRIFCRPEVAVHTLAAASVERPVSS